MFTVYARCSLYNTEINTNNLIKRYILIALKTSCKNNVSVIKKRDFIKSTAHTREIALLFLVVTKLWYIQLCSWFKCNSNTTIPATALYKIVRRSSWLAGINSNINIICRRWLCMIKVVLFITLYYKFMRCFDLRHSSCFTFQ